VKRIDVLPDDVLLEIFDFYVDQDDVGLPQNPWHTNGKKIVAWQVLVHVCRRWRSLVFRSPRRLNLQLFCTSETPAKNTLDVWPALPLIVLGDEALLLGTDNVIAALEQNNRVCQIALNITRNWQLEEVMAAMEVSFPELTYLHITSYDETFPVIPDSFLGGSAPSLRHFYLDCILFPGLPNLILSVNHLVELGLTNIPHSGYISPEAIVALISALSSLEKLGLGFHSPQSSPGRESLSLPPPNRSILPALSRLNFKGVTEYLEEFVTPQLDKMYITFFNQIDFDCPRLTQFINCTPTLMALDEAHVQFGGIAASVNLLKRSSGPEIGLHNLRISVSCDPLDWQLSSIEQFCNSSLHPISTVEDLYITHLFGEWVWKNDAVMKALCLELLFPFTAVKNLYLSKEFAPGIVATLEELIGGRITEVLPSLVGIFVERLEPSGTFQKSIRQFVAARQLSDHPVTISYWDR
jgi:hypothetical protein